MNLYEKPLYALRDLARRLGVSSPTVYKKTELIKLIEERKQELENNKSVNKMNRLGRPLLNNSYIAIRTNDDGTISFYDTEEPQSEKFAEQEQVAKKLPPPIKDAKTRNTLIEVKEVMYKFILAIDKVLERE